MGAGIAWFSIASALLPAVAITPWSAAAGLTLPAVLASRFLVGFGEGEGPSFTASTAARLLCLLQRQVLPLAGTSAVCPPSCPVLAAQLPATWQPLLL